MVPLDVGEVSQALCFRGFVEPTLRWGFLYRAAHDGPVRSVAFSPDGKLVLGIPEYGRERGSELMAHVGYELVLVLAGDLEVFDRFGKFASACLYFLKQPGVLYRYDCLVCKCLQERNLFFSRGAAIDDTYGLCCERAATFRPAS